MIKVNGDGSRKKDGKEIKGNKTRQQALFHRYFRPCYLFLNVFLHSVNTVCLFEEVCQKLTPSFTKEKTGKQ